MARVADPHAELPIKNFKYVKSCTEMVLAARRIERIGNFESFVNLEVLWINDNEIEALDGLDTCVRIKFLYAHNNRIRTLEGSSLRHFTFLTELRLFANKLRDLQGTLAVLSRLHHLEDLDLFGNPLQEEDNYRLQVIQAVPSLRVLDRHVITDEERAKAERFRPVSHDVGTLREAPGAKKKRPGAIAGAPPPQMSGTVRMLFREVAAIRREQKTNEREVAERELLELADAHKSLLADAASAGKPKRAGVVDNLDDWELAALRKRFHALEEKPNGGVARDAISELFAHLASRGYAVFVDGTQLDSSSDSVAKTLFPSDDRVVWTSVLQRLEARRIRCELLPASELMRGAARCFATSEELQARVQAMAASDPARQPLVKQSLELSQQAHRLQTLAEQQASSDLNPARQPALLKPSGSGLEPKTKFVVTTYGREVAPASVPTKPFATKFHELKEQSAQVDAALAAKYRLHQKDYAKYLDKHTPQSAKLVKHTFRL